jgi:hypothetical protein
MDAPEVTKDLQNNQAPGISTTEKPGKPSRSRIIEP